MDDKKKCLKGSDSRDCFKLWHKELDKTFYSTDLDLVFVRKFPDAKIVAVIDYKKHRDQTTFSEVIAYNDLMKRGIAVYLFYSHPDLPPYETISVKKYLGGNWDFPPKVEVNDELVNVTVEEYSKWERKLRLK